MLRMGTAASALLAIAAVGCVSGAKVRADAVVVKADVERARRSGAMRCAPRELATAEANIEFALGDLSLGDAVRAGTEIHDADSAAKKAIQLSAACAPKQVLVREGGERPTILTPSPLPNGSVGARYDEGMFAQGGSPPYKWAITTGSPSDGLTFTQLGRLAGTPTKAGIANFQVQVTDANGQTNVQNYQLEIVVGVTITTANLPDAVVGTPYNTTLAAAGGTTPYAWKLVGTGALPNGILLDPGGTIAGSAPTGSIGSATIDVEVTDTQGKTASKIFTVRVVEALTINATVAEGYADVPYSQTLTAVGGRPPYTWAIQSGSLPAGLKVGGDAIAGTPTAAGSSDFTVQVTDANQGTATKALTLVVKDPPSIATTKIPDGNQDAEYAPFTIQGAGGKTPYSFSLTTGTLPDGLTMSAAGVVSGKPTTLGSSTFTVGLQDANTKAASREFTVEIKPSKTYKMIVVKRDKIELKQQIRFKTAKSDIVGTDSFAIIGEVAQALRDNTQIKKIRIEGHTDSVGGDAYNMKLSQARADSVKNALIKQGIDPDRMESVGFGLTRPIESNKTKAGRAANRRTEFNVVDQ
jgi:outer membrane protein OmpA-like peptidoglycan-associated protein